MKNTFYKIAILSILFISLSSCENNGYEDYTAEATSTVDLNGEWFIDITKASDGSVQVQHALHKTYDSNDGKMYITDRIPNSNPPRFTGYNLETKLDTNTKDLTFSVTDALNTADDTKVKITEGKIVKGGGVSKDGNIVDSIYFKGEFSYEPGIIYIFKGHKRTRFLEDEY